MNQIAMSHTPAGFWKRYVAYFIDVVLVYLVLELLSRLFFSAPGDGDIQQLRSILTAVQNQQELSPDQTALLAHALASLSSMLVFSSLAYVVIAGAYFALCESSRWQATLGKHLLGIKVVDAGGKRIGFGRAVGRFFAAGLSWLSLNIGHAMVAWTRERRALHDYVADTRVENVDAARTHMPLWGWLIVGAHALLFMFGVVAVFAAIASAFNAATQI